MPSCESLVTNAHVFIKISQVRPVHILFLVSLSRIVCNSREAFCSSFFYSSRSLRKRSISSNSCARSLSSRTHFMCDRCVCVTVSKDCVSFKSPWLPSVLQFDSTKLSSGPVTFKSLAISEKCCAKSDVFRSADSFESFCERRRL